MAEGGRGVVKLLPPPLPPLEVVTDTARGGENFLAIAQGATPVMVKGGGCPELAPFHVTEEVGRGLRLGGGRLGTSPLLA